jgi:hypothetical protein
MTPLQRPADFRDRDRFTLAEAAEYERTIEDRMRRALPSDADRLLQVDFDDMYVEREVMRIEGLRTSLIVDPAHGMLPPLVPAARERIAARPKRTFDGPEVFNLAERCIAGNFGLGGSMASPPMIPSLAVPSYFQFVQNETHVLIATEWIHDARVIRLNGTHLAPSIRKWTGDSIGWYEGDTLVVDTTNFRPEMHNLDSGERLHVVERFTRVDAGTMRYRVTAEDPDTWPTPWTAEWLFTASTARMFPIECHEGNYAIEHFLRGARYQERQDRP